MGTGNRICGYIIEPSTFIKCELQITKLREAKRTLLFTIH